MGVALPSTALAMVNVWRKVLFLVFYFSFIMGVNRNLFRSALNGGWFKWKMTDAILFPHMMTTIKSCGHRSLRLLTHFNEYCTFRLFTSKTAKKWGQFLASRLPKNYFQLKFRDYSTLKAEGPYNMSGSRGSVTDDTPYHGAYSVSRHRWSRFKSRSLSRPAMRVTAML